MRFVDCVGQSGTDIGENLPWLLGAQNDGPFRHVAPSLGFGIQFGERSRWLVPRSGADVRVPPNTGIGSVADRRRFGIFGGWLDESGTRVPPLEVLTHERTSAGA